MLTIIWLKSRKNFQKAKWLSYHTLFQVFGWWQKKNKQFRKDLLLMDMQCWLNNLMVRIKFLLQGVRVMSSPQYWMINTNIIRWFKDLRVWRWVILKFQVMKVLNWRLSEWIMPHSNTMKLTRPKRLNYWRISSFSTWIIPCYSTQNTSFQNHQRIWELINMCIQYLLSWKLENLSNILTLQVSNSTSFLNKNSH